jgi:DNA-binding IclR family transcriptional regulator
MLAYDEHRQTYHLGLRLMRLAHASWTQSGIADAAREVLDGLVTELDMTVHLAVLDNGQVLYVDKRTPARPVTMFSSAGKVGPLYCTGVGKAMAAFVGDEQREELLKQQSYYRYTKHTLMSADALRVELDAVRREGHAFDRQEHEPDIICVAAPIISVRGNVLGALSVTTTIHSSSLKKLEKLAPRIRRAAAEIAHQATVRMIPGT